MAEYVRGVTSVGGAGVSGRYIGSESAVDVYVTYSRLIDIAIASLILVVTLPILVLAIIAIFLENPKGRIFFVQKRYGHLGQPFRMIKLRTMVPDAEALKASLLDKSTDKGPGFKLDNDPRITAVGRILRKLYIDEIPQCINVLRGEMAMVGPRANSYDPSSYQPWQRIRLAVKPGITGLWQVAEVKPESFGERCELDLRYITQKSIYFDLSIMVATAVMLLTRVSGR